MRAIRRSLKNISVLVGLCLLAGVIGAQAASLSVTNTADAGSGSLRQAIIDATTNAEANIVTIAIPISDPGYDPVENRFTIDLLTPLPDIPLAPMSISNNQPHEVRINGNGTFRIFTLVNSAVLTINNLSITNGFANNGLGGGIYMGDSSTMTLNGSIVSNNIAASNGGGIYMSNSGTLHLNQSNIRDNRAINGGGIFIFDSGTLNIDASTINSNTAISGGNGGGIFNGTSGTINGTSNTIDGNTAANLGGGIYNTATMTMTNNTISSNMAEVEGGGIYNGFTATLQNNLVALNTAATSNDLFGAYAGSFNLIGNADGSSGVGSAPNRSGSTADPLDPLLGPLQHNGGMTFTRELLYQSPAIDKGNSATIITDQRGLPRPFDNPEIPNDGGNGSDIGAFEVQTILAPDATPTPTPTVEPSPTPTVEPSPTPTVEPSPTPTVEPSPTPTVEPSPTPTVEPSPTPTVEPSPTPTVVPSPTPTVVPSPTPTVQPSPTPTVAPSPTPTVQPSPTPTVVPSPTPTVVPSPTPTVTPSPTITPSPTPTGGPWEGDINRGDPNVSGPGDGNVDNLDLFWYVEFAQGRHCQSEGVGGEFQRMDGNDSGGIDAGDYNYIFSVWLGLMPKVGAKGESQRPTGLCDGVPSMLNEAGTGMFAIGSDAMDSASIRIGSTGGQPGDQVLVPIVVESNGTLGSTGITIAYDPAVLSLSPVDGFGNPDVLKGPGASLNQVIGVNSSHGNIIVGIDFSGSSNPAIPLPSGTRQIALLRFTINGGATVGTTTPVTITPKTTVDISGKVVTGVSVESGAVTIDGPRARVISGRVLTDRGTGIRGASVVLTDSEGRRRTVTTSSVGYFEIADIETGQTYVITAGSRRYRFLPRTITVNDSLTDINLVGIE